MESLGSRRVFWSIAAAATVVGACDLSGGPHDVDARGGRNDLRDASFWPTCEVGDAEVRLGAVEGRGEDLFFGVVAVRFLPSGGLAVLNRRTQQVRLYSAEGRLQATLGGRGDGPGELRDPIAMEVSGDSVAVWDWRQSRVTLFPLSGGDPRTVRLTPSPPNPAEFFGIASEPRRLILGARPLSEVGRTPDDGQQNLQVLSYAPTGEVTDTVEVIPDGKILWIDEARREAGQPWFQGRALFTARGNRLYTTTGTAPVVGIRPLSELDRSDTLTWMAPDRRVRSEHVDTFKSATRRRFADNPVLAARLERRWSALPPADSFPALSSISADDQGNVWIQQFLRPGATEQIWWHFGPDGAFRCAIPFPVRFEPSEFRKDAVVGVARDEMGVEFVEVRPISAPN